MVDAINVVPLSMEKQIVISNLLIGQWKAMTFELKREFLWVCKAEMNNKWCWCEWYNWGKVEYTTGKLLNNMG